MDAIEAISSRRSIGRMLPQAPPREQIQRLLDAAVCAPNHRLTRPWRFFVLSGAARDSLGAAQEVALRRSLADPEAPASVALLAKERAKPQRAPVVVVVACEPSTAPNVPVLEEIGATAAAIQNLLLAAHAEGLAAIWRTGESAFSAEVRNLFALSERATVLGIIYLGYADPAQLPTPRASQPAPATWLGWPDTA